MGRLTDLKVTRCKKRSQKWGQDKKWTFHIWALWYHMLQRCHDGLQPRRKKEGSGEGFGKRCANGVPSGPAQQAKSLIFDGGYSKITLLAVLPRTRKSLQKGSHFGGVWAHYTLQGSFRGLLRQLFEATFSRVRFRTRTFDTPS